MLLLLLTQLLLKTPFSFCTKVSFRTKHWRWSSASSPLNRVRYATVYGAIFSWNNKIRSIYGSVTQDNSLKKLNLSKGNEWVLCFLAGLVADAAKNELESSHCCFVTTPSLMLMPTSLFSMKSNCLVLNNSKPSHLIESNKRISGQTRRAGVCRISTSGDMDPFFNAGAFQEFTYMISIQGGLFVVWVRWTATRLYYLRTWRLCLQ